MSGNYSVDVIEEWLIFVLISNRPATIVGLLLIGIGSGGIKPCVSAFGADQFKLPEQLGQMATYFSIFYFSINGGSLISTFLTPILREDVYCFEEKDCYPLAFGVPCVLMILSIGKAFLSSSFEWLYFNGIRSEFQYFSLAANRSTKSFRRQEIWWRKSQNVSG